MLSQFENAYVINLYNNSKRPINKNWNREPFNKDVINKNYSLLTGRINGFFVVDVDLLENKTATNHYWKNLIDSHGKPKTLTIRTPSGGLHYFFKYDEDIKTSISLKINDESTHIDIINESKDGKPLNIVGVGSIIDDREYTLKYNNKIKKVPQWLKEIIVHNQLTADKVKIENYINKKNSISLYNKVFNITENEVNNILNKLDISWNTDFKKWSIVTNILKGLNYKELWNNWSKKSNKYNGVNNNILWDAELPKFDINLILNELDIKNIPFTYKYNSITDIKNIEEVQQNNRYVNFDNVYNVGWTKKVLIIKSDTGTGKTTRTFKYFKKGEYKYILSIVSRRSLVNQHIESAKKEGIKMYGYEEEKIEKRDIVCYQLDSILKFLTDRRREDISKYAIYMDEINSTLKYLINSSTMEKKRIDLFNTLNFIIRKAHIIICSDADVSDVVFKYISNFRNVKECVYINNLYKNYSNINAYKNNDPNIMIEKIKYKISIDEGFIACFDQLKFLDQIFYNVYDETKKSKFLKITSKDDDFTNTEIWKNKFVFYTPKIIYGNDFVPLNRTDIFVFSKGGSIDSLQIVQQATRCRVIKDLYYYIKVAPKFLKYKNETDCKNKINNEKKVHYQILKELNCITHTDDARTIIEDNIYTDMFIYNEMCDDLLKSNYLYHFEEIIRNKGFNIIDLDECTRTLKKEYKQKAVSGENDKLVEVKKLYIDGNLQYNHKQLYDLVENRRTILNLDKKEIEDYIDILFYDKEFNNHLSISKLFRTIESVNEEYKNEMSEKQIKSIYSKIILIEYIEKILNINRFDFEIDFDKINNKYDTWTLDHNKKYANIIKSRHDYNNEYYALFKMRNTLYKSFNKDSFTNKRVSKNSKYYYTLELDDNNIKYHYTLFSKRQGSKKNINKNIYDLCNTS